jgi:hypothetical protein
MIPIPFPERAKTHNYFGCGFVISTDHVLEAVWMTNGWDGYILHHENLHLTDLCSVSPDIRLLA